MSRLVYLCRGYSKTFHPVSLIDDEPLQAEQRAHHILWAHRLLVMKKGHMCDMDAVHRVRKYINHVTRHLNTSLG